MRVGDVFDAAAVPERKKRMLTIEVRLERENGRLLRDPMLLSVQYYRLPEGLLKAGSVGSPVGSLSYNDFLNLLLA